MRGLPGGGVIFFSDCKTMIFILFVVLYEFFLKKYFVGMEKGCIFASAFDEKRHVEKAVDKRGSDSTLKRMRRKR